MWVTIRTCALDARTAVYIACSNIFKNDLIDHRHGGPLFNGQKYEALINVLR